MLIALSIALLLIATLNAVLCGYQLTQGFSLPITDAARNGNFVFAGLSFTTAITLYITCYFVLWNYSHH